MDNTLAFGAFPSVHRLWQGVILSTIAHAIWVAAYPLLSGEEGWDGPNYWLTNGSGAYATVTFAEQFMVAAFYDLHSTRSPTRLDASEPYDPGTYFASAPIEVWELAQRETLQYLHFDFAPQELPLVTAACWSEGEQMTAGEAWPEVVAHGAHLLDRQFLPAEQAIIAWQEIYQFADDQVRLLGELYWRKLHHSGSLTQLTRDEQYILFAYGDAGRDASAAILKAIGIAFPE